MQKNYAMDVAAWENQSTSDLYIVCTCNKTTSVQKRTSSYVLCSGGQQGWEDIAWARDSNWDE